MPLKTLLIQVSSILITLLLGWILVHVIAVLGIFLVAAIPILHLFFYPRIFCFWCQLKKTPHNLRHSFIDSAFMLCLTIISIGIVYGETKFLRLSNIFVSPQSVSFVIPNEKQFRLGELINLRIELEGLSQPINAVAADLHFDPEMLETKAITTQGSFATIFLAKDYNNDQGYIHISGGIENPGYLPKDRSLFATVYFKSLKAGLTTVQYLPTSLALSNDGKGSNILNNFGKISYLITADPISVEEQRIQENILIHEQTDGTKIQGQLTFYDSPLAYGNDSKGEVLGENADLTPNIAVSLTQQLLSNIHKIDQAIISIWQMILR